MPGRQVRLEADTLALVEAEQDRVGGSLSAAANRLLRQIKPETPSEPARASATVVRAPGTQRAPRRPTQATTAKRGPCTHPLLRRIGNSCAACGQTV